MGVSGGEKSRVGVRPKDGLPQLGVQLPLSSRPFVLAEWPSLNYPSILYLSFLFC